jgi:hypothetical protein
MPFSVASEIRVSNRVHHLKIILIKFVHGIKALINSGQKNHIDTKYFIIPPLVLGNNAPETTRFAMNLCCIVNVCIPFFLIINGLFGCVLRSWTVLNLVFGKWLSKLSQHVCA